MKVTRPSSVIVACFLDSVSRALPTLHLTLCLSRTGVTAPYICTCLPTATVFGTVFLFVICTPVGHILPAKLWSTATSALSEARTFPLSLTSRAVIVIVILFSIFSRASPIVWLMPFTIATTKSVLRLLSLRSIPAFAKAFSIASAVALPISGVGRTSLSSQYLMTAAFE